jgi:lipopolysaccharide transport protein LptA
MRLSWKPVWLGALGLLLAEVCVCAQTTGASVSDVLVPIREKDKLKAVVTGKNAKPQKNGLVLVNQFRMESYREGDRNKKDLIIEAPECYFNPTNYDATSASKFQVQTGDGRFSIAGEGWEWRQASGVLAVSNRVQTVVRGDLLGAAPTHATAASLPEGRRKDLHIAADHFQFDSKTNLAVYRDNVRASDQQQIQLSSGQLTLKIPPSGGKLDSIAAEQNVLIDLTDDEGNVSHASGDQAVYRILTNGAVTLQLTGQPAWQSKDSSGKGDVLFLKPQTKEFSVTGNASVRLPRPVSVTTNAPPVNPSGTTNSFIEIHSDEYEIKDNAAFFRGQVRARQEPDWTLSSGILSTVFSTNRHELEKAVAEQNVRLIFKKSGQESRAAGQKAIYTFGANGSESIQMTGNPTWNTRRYEGSGTVLTLNPRGNEFKASGDAVLELLPEPDVARSKPNAPGQKPVPIAVDQPVEVFSDEYELKGDIAEFHGHVLVNHPEWKLTGGQLRAKIAAPGNRLEQIDAKQNVMVVHSGSRPAHLKPGQASAPASLTADSQAPWTLACDEMALELDALGAQIERISADGNVVFEQSGARAAGRHGEYDLASDRFRLSGGPTLRTADGTTITGANVLVFNLGTNTFEAVGRYKVAIPNDVVDKGRVTLPGK